MAKYFYSNTAVETTLAGNISSAATTLTVTAATGFPVSFPYVLAVGYGATDEELVKVTGASGTALSVERGFGGTSAQSHSLGAVVRHVYNAQDATDFRTHEETGADTHGVTGEIVGTGDTQTLANKTLTSPTIQSGALSGTFTGAPEYSGDATYTGAPTFTGNVTFTGGPDFTTAAPSFIGDTFGTTVIRTSATGEAVDRFQMRADGSMGWGDGTGARSVSFGRRDDSADSMGTGLITNSPLWFTRPSGNHDIIDTQVDGDAGIRFGIEADGSLFWGDGTSTTADCGLNRTGPDAMEMSATFRSTVQTDDTFTAASGFSVITADLRKTAGVCTISLRLNVTSTIAAESDGNITDQSVGVLPSGYRPATDQHYAVWSNSIVGGTCSISDTGIVTLRTAVPNVSIEAGTNMRISATFVQ